MKKLIALASLLSLTLFLVLGTVAQDKNELLWLVSGEKVKPEMIKQYKEISKELIELCNSENFPYSFNVWSSQPFHFELWYPIEEMNDITRIEETWDAIVEKFGSDKFSKFQECIESQSSKVMTTLLDLSYEPESPRLSEEEIGFCFWQEIHVKKGSEKTVEDIFKKGSAILKDKGIEGATYVGEGKIGYEQPVYFAWSYGKHRSDYKEQQKKEAELLGEEWSQLNAELIKHIKDIVNSNESWLKELSYNSE